MIQLDVTSFEAFVRDRSDFEQLLGNLPDCLLGIGEDGAIVFADAQTERLFGVAHDDLIGRSIESLMPARFRARHEGDRAAFFKHPVRRVHGSDLDIHALRADGSEFPADIALSNFQVGDTMIAVASVRDLSEHTSSSQTRAQMAAELELIRSRRLESIGQLVGGIAHDFNNLLAVIINYAELAEEAVDTADVKEDIKQIRESALRAATLTRQLLIFSRREVVRPVPLSVNSMIGDIQKLLQRTLGEQIELQMNLGAEIWTVTADAGQLEQVVVNLAVNARDAMHGGGLLQIETSNIVIDAEYLRTEDAAPTPGRYVMIDISDTGTGMTAEVRDRAFEPFFTTKGEAEGTGLGLATVFGIVKRAGGHIFIFSELGRGTSIKIFLPTSASAIQSPAPDVLPAPASGEGEAILIVEDEPALRRLVARVLEKAGFSVLAMPDAAEAIAVLADHEAKVDLLLTDVIMPGMQGNELAERAVELRPELSVLLMSGYSEEMIARIDGDGEGLNLVEKPFTRDHLLRAVESALHKQRRSAIPS